MAALTISHEAWLARFAERFADRFDYSATEQITGSTQRITITCREHGPFVQQVYKHYNATENPCKACRLRANGVKHRKGRDALIAEIHARFGDTYDCTEVEYEGYKLPVKLTCKLHGPFVQTPRMLRLGYGCSHCGIDRGRTARKFQVFARKPVADFLIDAQRIHGDRFTYEKVVHYSATSPVEITCPTHGPFWQTPTNHLTGHGCPRCGTGGRISQVEDRLFKLVQSLDASAVQSHRALIAPFELDIYVPSRNLAIELNGVYWHADTRSEALAHRRKYEACKAKGVRLLQFTDVEYETKPEIVERMVRNAMGASSDAKLNARDCEVRELDAATASKFINTWHLQGTRAVSAHRFGLFHPDAGLVAVMTFGKDIYRRNRTEADMGTWDLTRFATCASVRGGASKLFAHACKALSIARCVSYSMNDWFDGEMYARLGFEKVADIAPDYRVYHAKTGLLTKQRWQRKHIAARLTEIGRGDLLPYDSETDPRTEQAMQDACGALRIYDSGKSRWVYTQA